MHGAVTKHESVRTIRLVVDLPHSVVTEKEEVACMLAEYGTAIDHEARDEAVNAEKDCECLPRHPGGVHIAR